MKRIEITKSAAKELAGFSRDVQIRLAAKIKPLAENPFPPNAKKLKGDLGYRIRSGDYRIIYKIGEETVKILAIGNRKDVYR